MDEQGIEPQYVTVVNRLAETREFMGWGRPHVFKAGEARAVSRPFAEWIFSRGDGPTKVHTVEAGYTFWLGVKEAPSDLIDQLPERVFETTPLTLETGHVEGWDTSVIDRDPTKTVTKEVARQRADFANQGGAVAGILGAPAKVTR
jgi:hypothetical protein